MRAWFTNHAFLQRRRRGKKRTIAPPQVAPAVRCCSLSKNPYNFVVLLPCRSCRDGQFLSFNEERNQRRSKRKFPLLELPLLPRCDANLLALRSRCASTSQVARYAARRGCVASHRIATLPCSTPQSAGGSVPVTMQGKCLFFFFVALRRKRRPVWVRAPLSHCRGRKVF